MEIRSTIYQSRAGSIVIALYNNSLYIILNKNEASHIRLNELEDFNQQDFDDFYKQELRR